MATYKSRIADQMLAARLRRKGAVLVEGPKWCGKTTTAEQQAKSILYMADPMRKQQNLQAARLNVQHLLDKQFVQQVLVVVELALLLVVAVVVLALLLVAAVVV